MSALHRKVFLDGKIAATQMWPTLDTCLVQFCKLDSNGQSWIPSLDIFCMEFSSTWVKMGLLQVAPI